MDRIDMKRVQILDALATIQRRNGGGDVTVGQVMTPQPSCIPAQTNVIELVRLFHAKAFRHLLVTDEQGRLLGVISDRDVLRCLGPGAADKQRLTQTAARDLMSNDVVTISSVTSVAQAIPVLINHGIGCLPVVDDGQLVGIMTSTDLHVLLQMLLQASRLTVSEKSSAAART